jgi:hypothetical protein
MCRPARRVSVYHEVETPARRGGHRSGTGVVVATAALTLAAVAGGVAAADPLVPQLGSNFFPISVFYQPAFADHSTTLAGWKARGVNTLVGYETQGNTVTIDQYSAAAVAAGMYMIRQPRANPADDATQQNLIGFLQPDEPEINGYSAALLQANYAAWKAAVPNMPVLLNVDGSHVIGWQSGATRQNYVDWFKGADWASDDIYPVTGFINPAAISAVGQAVDTLRSYVNKPGMAVIETSNQRLFVNSNPQWPERGVTPGEFREEVWDALIHHANGIMYFPQSFNAFHYDATPIDVAQEMIRQNTVIQSLAPVLNSSETADVSTVRLTGGTDGNGGGLEARVQSYNGVTYVIVLNQTGSALTGTISASFAYGDNGLQVLGEDRTLSPLNLSGTPTYSDSFAPFALHIYAEGPAGATPLAIAAPDVAPEPSAVVLLAAAAASAGLLRRSRRRRRPC